MTRAELQRRTRLVSPSQASRSGGDDRALLAQLASGDRAALAALAALYDRHAGELWAVAVHVLRCEPVRGEDALHDVWLDVWRLAATAEGPTAPIRPWLVRRLVRRLAAARDAQR